MKTTQSSTKTTPYQAPHAMIPCKRALLATALFCCDGVTGFSPTTTCPRNNLVNHVTWSRSMSVLSTALSQAGSLQVMASSTHGATAPVFEQNQLKRRWQNAKKLLPKKLRLLKLWSSFRKVMTCTFLALVLSMTVLSSSALAVTGGRMGGNFGPSGSSRSSSRSPSSPMRSYHSPHRGFGRSHTVVYRNSPTVYYSRSPHTAYRISPVSVAVMTGVVLYAAANLETDHSSKPRSALGPGFSVASLTVALDVPDRDASDSVLVRLKRFSDMAQTGTRRGVQDLITNGEIKTTVVIFMCDTARL